MRCGYCHEPAGWWHRRCTVCRRLQQEFLAHRGADMATLLERLLATGAPQRTVEQFLDADPDGNGSVRDQVAADMTNQLLEAFGQRTRQSPAEVKRLRERGTWRSFDRRPPE